MTDPAVAAALLGSHTPVARLLALAQDRVTIRRTWEAGPRAILLSGSVTYDRTREVRRTASVELSNPDGALSPHSPGDLFFPGEWIRVERGLRLSGQAIHLPLFTGVVTGYDSTMTGHLVVTAEDSLTLLRQPLGDVLTIEASTAAKDALRTLWEPVLGSGAAWRLDDGGRTLGATRTWAEDDDRLEAGISLMADMGLEAWADRLGDVVLRPVPDPTMAPTVRTITRERGVAVMTDLTRSGTARPYNKVVVIGEGPDRPTFRAEAEVTDAASPINRSRIGLQVAPYYRSAQIADQATANAVSLVKLVEYALYQDAIGGTSTPDPTLDEDDVVAWVEPISGTEDRYRLDSVTHPVVMGGLSVTATRIVTVAAAPPAASQPAPHPFTPPPPPPPPPGPPDCDVSLQAAIDAATAGDVLDLTGCSYTAGAVIDKALTLKGCAIDFSGGTCLSVTADDVTIDQVSITGPDATAATYDDDARGIDVSATDTSPISGLVIKRSTITGIGGYGIRLQNVVAPVIGGAGVGNTITDIGYTGIMLLSAIGGTVQENTVRRIGVHTHIGGGTDYNAYGITCSRQSSGEPVCSDVLVQDNIVSDVPNWHGLDTHAGLRISWIGNHVSRTNRACFITGDSYGEVAQDNVYTGNTADEPTPRADVIGTYPYNEVGLTIVSGITGTTGSGNFFDGWPTGNAISGATGTNVITGSTITGSY